MERVMELIQLGKKRNLTYEESITLKMLGEQGTPEIQEASAKVISDMKTLGIVARPEAEILEEQVITTLNEI